jgi:ABC-2 type transport system ATP-binding protein
VTISAPSSALHASELKKSYAGGRGKPRIQALDSLSLDAEAGTIFGLLGPNGAGKSTAVKVLSTLSRADSGSAFVAGIDVAKHPENVRRSIGYVAQKSDDYYRRGLGLLLAGITKE